MRVYRREGLWRIERGDFRAELDTRERRGRIRQTANPYSIDTLLRIVHTLALAPQGGLLLHAASVVRRGRALVFAGASGAGKTTLSRLAPNGTAVLTDEVSYVRRDGEGYRPRAGWLACRWAARHTPRVPAVPAKHQPSLATWLANLTGHHHERLPSDRAGDGNQYQPICAALRI